MKLRIKLLGAVVATVGIAVASVSLAGNASAAPSGRVLADPCLNLRAGYDQATGWDTMLGCIPIATTITIECVNDGLLVSGPYGSETIWDRTTWNGTTGYVSDAWVYTGSNGAVAPACGAPTPEPPPTPSTSAQYVIAWTGGIGIYPRSVTSMSSAKVGAALVEGAAVTLTCETYGETVTDTAGYTSNIWDQLPNGAYVANVYINTGVNGRTPGVPECLSTPTPSTAKYNRQAAILWAIQHVYDPELIHGGDCTWFASQVLWAGGLPKSSMWTSTGPTRTAKFANLLPRYLADQRLGSLKQINWSDNTAGNAQVGDLIVYDWETQSGRSGSDGAFDHIAVVTKIGEDGYPRVSQHTPAQLNRFWSWSETANNWIQLARPGAKVYVLHVTY